MIKHTNNSQTHTAIFTNTHHFTYIMHLSTRDYEGAIFLKEVNMYVCTDYICMLRL